MSLQDCSEYIPDMRDIKNQVFTCSGIVFIAMVSVLCGAETWPEVEMFGKCHMDYFKHRLPNLVHIPSEETFECFFLLLDTAWFERAFREWATDDICSLVPGVIAMDGKAVCVNSKVHGGMKNRLYMVSAWAVSNVICLRHMKVDSKSNEITALPALIKVLDMGQCIVTIDAAGCQKI